MIPAVGYCRVSGKSQLDGDGFPRQRQAPEQCRSDSQESKLIPCQHPR